MIALQQERTQSGDQVEHGGGHGAATHAEGGDQHKGGEQGADNGPGSVGGIQPATGPAQVLRVSRQCAHQYRQGAAHQQRRQTHQQQG